MQIHLRIYHYNSQEYAYADIEIDEDLLRLHTLDTQSRHDFIVSRISRYIEPALIVHDKNVIRKRLHDLANEPGPII